jgi:hemolysin D
MASANQNLVPFPKRPVRRTNYELAFLPAALEIAETPPSPVGRAVGATIIAIFCVALGWAIFGQVDIVATANGQRQDQADPAARDRRLPAAGPS